MWTAVVEKKVGRAGVNIVDTHSHALPLVDHGSPDMATTVRMIEASVLQGAVTICCTPHLYDFDRPLIERTRQVFDEVVAAVAQAGIQVTLRLGFEVSLLLAATTDPESLRSVGIGGGAGEGREGEGGDPDTRPLPLLIEMPYSNWPPMFEQTIARLATGGFLPIIAHPERNDRVRRSPDVLVPCIEAGAILQGTAGSFSDIFRSDSQKTFYEILSRGWYSLLASDAHSEPKYTWTVGPLLSELGKRITEQEREMLVSANPARVLRGQRPLPLRAGRTPAKGRRRF